MQEEGTTFEQARDDLQGRFGEGKRREPAEETVAPTPTTPAAPESDTPISGEGSSSPPPRSE